MTETVEWTVHYEIGTYSGDVTVRADKDADREHVVALAKRRLYRDGHPGVVYESFRITRRGQ